VAKTHCGVGTPAYRPGYDANNQEAWPEDSGVTCQYDVFTIGAGYLDVQAALSVPISVLVLRNRPRRSTTRRLTASTSSKTRRPCGEVPPCGRAQPCGAAARRRGSAPCGARAPW